eukprot:m.163400 g.163400  ORF g.163400 m.163400 type:complete len:266 (-) comp14383_c0_seq3:1283-2080(-)
MAKKAVKKKGSKKGKSKASKKEGKDAAADGPHLPTAEEKLWQARFAISEQARKEHRSNAQVLVQANADLQTQMQDTERDSLEVVAYLRRELAVVQDELKAAKDDMMETRRQAQREIDEAERVCNVKVADLQLKLTDQQSQLDATRAELVALKEFRQHRDVLERQVDDLKELNSKLLQQHEKHVQHMETKFFEEKARMQKATETQLVTLAQQAHDEAIRNATFVRSIDLPAGCMCVCVLIRALCCVENWIWPREIHLKRMQSFKRK